MATIEEKHIAKEILIEMIKTEKHLIRTEYPASKTVANMVCAAYKEILQTIAKPE